MERKNFLKTVGLGAAGILIAGRATAAKNIKINSTIMENLSTTEFPALPYAYDALEPHIDARTMEIHYDRHHRTYFNNYVAAVKGTQYESMPIEKVFGEVSKAGDPIRNNGGGYYNHVIFWRNMGKGQTAPSAGLTAAINSAFGSFDKFKETFNNAAKTRFGSSNA
jgi:Fe-Mn family superoxide dismutase